MQGTMDDLVHTLNTFHREFGGDINLLVPRLYPELHALAQRQIVRERAGHTLSATALIHEAYLRLADDPRLCQQGRAYFFAAAARAMRRILVEHARARGRQKRGGGLRATTLHDHHASIEDFAGDLIDLDSALHELEQLNPRHGQVVECRFFGGLDIKETAHALQVSERTVKQDWALARAWLYQRLNRNDGSKRMESH